MLPDIGSVDAKIRELILNWEDCRPAPHLLPGRQHFDPATVPRLLPNIFMFEVVGTPARFRFKLLGQKIIDSGGPGRKGTFVDELPRTGTKAYLHDQLSDILRTCEPVYYKGPPTLKHHRFVTGLEGIMLPLASNGTDIDQLLCLTVYSWSDGKTT